MVKSFRSPGPGYKSAQFSPGLEHPFFLREPPPPPPAPFWVPLRSEANLKDYPLFVTAIQIGACKLYETL